MVPDSFTNYFIASVGASAALIGLLFVAITVAPERVFGSESTVGRRAMAGGAFLALLNAFFVSLAALVPGANIGYMALALSAIALINTASLGWRVLSTWRISRDTEGLLVTLGSVVIYGEELRYALPLLQHGHDTSALYGVVYLLVAIYALGVGRAWTLLGGGKDGLLSLLGLHGIGHAEKPALPLDATQLASSAEGYQTAE